MHARLLTLVACALPALAAFEYPGFVPLHRRQAPGTPEYECHANCGGVIVDARTAGYCDTSQYSSQLAACLDCALVYDIWQYYGTSVTKAAEVCGDSSTPVEPPSTSSTTTTTLPETTTPAAETTAEPTSSATPTTSAESTEVTTTSSEITSVSTEIPAETTTVAVETTTEAPVVPTESADASSIPSSTITAPVVEFTGAGAKLLTGPAGAWSAITSCLAIIFGISLFAA